MIEVPVFSPILIFNCFDDLIDRDFFHHEFIKPHDFIQKVGISILNNFITLQLRKFTQDVLRIQML